MSQTMRTRRRPRRYISRTTLLLCRPGLAYSGRRDAYVLRVVGDHMGPVLREDRRRSRMIRSGPERRRSARGYPL